MNRVFLKTETMNTASTAVINGVYLVSDLVWQRRLNTRTTRASKGSSEWVAHLSLDVLSTDAVLSGQDSTGRTVATFTHGASREELDRGNRYQMIVTAMSPKEFSARPGPTAQLPLTTLDWAGTNDLRTVFTEGRRGEIWSEVKNARRVQLIEREIDGALSLGEALELANLQAELESHLQKVAPLPIDALGQLLERLRASRGALNE